MIQCPICSQECPTMICTVCGYDNSTDYEQFGSLCHIISATRSCSAVKVERAKHIDNLMLCKGCGGYFLSVTKDGKSLFCHKCGSLTPHPVWEALENRIAVFEKKIADMLSSDKNSLSSKNTHTFSVDTNVKHIPAGSSSSASISVSSPKKEVSCKPSILSAGRAFAILKNGDQVHFWKRQDIPLQVSIPRDLIDASAGDSHGVFLPKNGKAIAFGSSVEGQCRVEHWSDLKAVSAGGAHTIGLKYNGRVVAVGRDYEQQCQTGDWRDVVQISAGGWHTLGLLRNKRVVATGNLLACDGVEAWRNVVAVSAGDNHSLGLLDNGKVVATGWKSDGRCKVDQWENIIRISAGKTHSVGLKKDGTVVATGENKHGECNVEQWRSIVAVSAGEYYTLGIGEDGSLHVCGEGKLVDEIRESPSPIGT